MQERTEIEVLLEGGATIATDEDMHSRGTDRKIEPDCPSLRKTYEEATNTPDTYESMDGGGYAPSKGAGAKIQSGYTPQNTPDTKEQKLREEIVGWMYHSLPRGKTIPNFEELVDSLLTSHDTYWKERVEGAYDEGYREGYGDGQDVI